MRVSLVMMLLFLSACSSEVYVRDGVTDGDTFYLAERALSDDDPAYQSWVTYSLARSTCQLEIGGDNPARQNSYDCEVSSRHLLLDTWQEKQLGDPAIRDDYLDDLNAVRQAGFLDEYVARHFRRNGWELPDDLQMSSYRRWMRSNLPYHDPETRITGSWNYARNVSGF